MSESMHEKLAYRLADMLTMLNMGNALDVGELAEKYQVSRRTIMRDIDERLAFLPLEKERGKYRLSSSYLGKLDFKDIRAFAQISGIAKLYPNLDTSFLREILDERATQIYLVKGYAFEDASLLDDVMDCIKQAIKEQKQLHFIYKDEERVVEPYRLIHHLGCWYLAGLEQGQIKTYHISRIRQLVLTNHVFMPQSDIEQEIVLDKGIWFGQQKIEVLMQVDAQVATYFKQRQLLPEQDILKEMSDGTLLLSCQVGHRLQLFPVVRWWIPHLKIISPSEWQEELVDGLKFYFEK